MKFRKKKVRSAKPRSAAVGQWEITSRPDDEYNEFDVGEREPNGDVKLVAVAPSEDAALRIVAAHNSIAHPPERRSRVIARHGMNVTRGAWVGDRLTSVETACRRAKGRTIEKASVTEAYPHADRDAIVTVAIDFKGGDVWSLEVEGPNEIDVLYVKRYRGGRTAAVDQKKFPAIERYRGMVYQRLSGQIVEEISVTESDPHDECDSAISVTIRLRGGHHWRAQLEAPRRCVAVYLKKRGRFDTTAHDEQEFLGIHQRRRDAARAERPAKKLRRAS